MIRPIEGAVFPLLFLRRFAASVVTIFSCFCLSWLGTVIFVQVGVYCEVF
jgi:hypothetical protein